MSLREQRREVWSEESGRTREKERERERVVERGWPDRGRERRNRAKRSAEERERDG